MYVDLHDYDRLIETPTSRLYFHDHLIYKVKKQGSDYFMSYSSRAERLVAIEREFSKGTKYSPRLYRTIVEVQEPGSSECEAAICMNYLGPHYSTLFSYLQRSPVALASLDLLLQKVRNFHNQTQAYEETDIFDSARMGQRLQLLLRETESLGIDVPNALVEGYERFIEHYQSEFPARLEKGYVRELHGDLHTDNILFCDDDFLFFDFLDFEEAFTIGDVAIDLSFLLSDFCYLGATYNLDSLLLSLGRLFEIDRKILLPLTAFGILNRANTFQVRVDRLHLAPEYYRLSTTVMEKYLNLVIERREPVHGVH